jgi:signal transduction histidine kinase/CheY-like chemotaxis protein/HPt (histidine-containing phosphotransfer) domain-containing protein
MDLKRLLRDNVIQILITFLVFSFMVVLSYFFTSNIVERHIAQGAEEMAVTAEAKIQAQFQEAYVSILQAAISVTRRVEMGQTPAQIENFLINLTDTLQRDADFLMGFIAFTGYVGDEFIHGARWQEPGDYVVRERPWYIAAMAQKGKVVFTDPYIDAYTGALIVTASITLTGDGGEDYGVIGIDLDLSEIAGYITTLQYSKGGYGVLIGSDLTVIAHPYEEFVGWPLEELGQDYGRLAKDLQARPKTIANFSMLNNQGVPVIVFYRQIVNGWYVGISTPRSSYLHDVYAMAVILSVIGLIMMVVLSCFTLRLSMAKIRSDEENKAKSSFLARVSHEIRTPMNSILGMSEIILRKNISEEVYEYASIIRQAGNTLLSIINDILDFSKIESGRLEIESRKYHVASLINDVVNVIRIRLAEKPVDFFVNLESSIPAELFGDDVRIRQILINILNNAVKYTREGHITLSVYMKRLSVNELTLTFSVEDSGIGISPGDMERLFTEFTRIDPEANRGIEGAGLGLTIANSFCQAMGGKITVESKYGKGSTFTATVVQTFEDPRPVARILSTGAKRILVYETRPKYATSLLEAFWSIGLHPAITEDMGEFMKALEGTGYDYAFISSNHASECISHWNKVNSSIRLVIMMELRETTAYRDMASIHMPIYSSVLANVLNGANSVTPAYGDKRISFTAPAARVLIVDDIATNLRVASELMAPYKMRIDTCLSGAEALKLIRSTRYDLVFMDHMMPEMDGLAATAQIRGLDNNDPYYRNVPVIMLTANAVSGQQDLFLRSGLNDFLAKPIGVQKLNEILHAWIPAEKQIACFVPLTSIGDAGEANGLDAIEGVDIQRGIAFAGGSAAAYKKVLAIFCADVEERMLRVKEEAGGVAKFGDLSLYVTLVHALKGACLSIGAGETGEFAAELEDAGRAGDRDVITKRTGAFLEQLETLRSRISTALEPRSPEEGGWEGDTPAIDLTPLREALSTLDTIQVNRLLSQYAEISPNKKTRALLAEIEQLVLLFDVEKAIEKIDGFM